MGAGTFFIDIKGWALELISIHPLPVLFAIFWIITLMTSLRGVDRRDELAHMTYSVVFMALAVILFVLSVGPSYLKANPAVTIIMCAVTIVVPGFRWGVQRKQSALEFVEQRIKPNK